MMALHKRKFVLSSLALLLIGVGLIIVTSNFRQEKIYAQYRYPFQISETQDDNFSADIIFYAERIKRDPEGASDLATLAELYLNRGKSSGDQTDFEKAITLANQSLKIRKAYNITASLVLADVAQIHHKFLDAIKMTKILLLEKPHDENLLLILVRSQIAIGDLKNAFLAVSTLLNINVTASALGLRALIHEASGREQQALSDFETAFRYEDSDRRNESVWLRNIYSRFNIRKKKFILAEYLLKNALQILPQDATTLGNIALLSEKRKDYHKAENFYEQAFASSRQLSFLVGKARVKKLAHEPGADQFVEQAEMLLREDIFKRGIGHRAELIELLLEKDNPDGYVEALILAKTELELRPNGQTFFLLARAYLKNGQRDKAKESLKFALDTGVQSEEMLALKGLL